MITVASLQEKKATGTSRISMVTAYDFFTASVVEAAGVDIILVGDSLGMVVQGRQDTISVTMDEMIYHTRIVTRTAKRSLVVADMPFLSYHTSDADAVSNAGRFLKEGRAGAVKLEGGVRVQDKIKLITSAEIPVMGHIGLTPQSIKKLGKYSVQGKEEGEKKRLFEDARAVEAAGAFAVVLECVPVDLAKELTQRLSIPTIGIGAGKYCDGQVLVFHDLAGLTGQSPAKFVKCYADLRTGALSAVEAFKKEVEDGMYPSEKESYH